MSRLKITTEFGTWEQAPVDPLRMVKNKARALVNRWKVDADGYIVNGPAITVMGRNRYSGQPVNSQGLTFEAWLLGQHLRKKFPGTPTQNNYAVDRNQNHDPDAPKSDHAYGEGLDMMIQAYDGNRFNITAVDATHGKAVCDELDRQMVGPVQVGLRGKRFQGPYRISYWLFNPNPPGDSDPGDIHYAQEGKRRKIQSATASRTHRNHVHITVVPVDRRGLEDPQPENQAPMPAPDDQPAYPRLRRGRNAGYEAEVRKVQVAVGGIPVDGKFGPVTERAVKAYQRRHKLYVDGVVGPQTWTAILAGKR